MLHHEYVKNNCIQNELDADPKTIQQKEFVGQLQNTHGVNGGGKKWATRNKETRLKFSQWTVTVLGISMS